MIGEVAEYVLREEIQNIGQTSVMFGVEKAERWCNP